MAYTDYLDDVQEIYIGYYQRPADPGGLVFWAQKLDGVGGNLDDIIEAFANSAEAQTLYGPINSETIGDVIDEIYMACFNRLPDPAGKAFYEAGFNAVPPIFTAATIMLNIIDGAQGEDLQTINNKLTAAELFTETIDPGLDGRDLQATYSGDADAQAGRDFLSINPPPPDVTFNPISIPTPGETTDYIQEFIADPGDPILGAGQTLILTENPDNFNLSSSHTVDTVRGIQSDDGTFTPGDLIVGNGETVFKLIADGGTPVVATVNNVAQIDLFSVADTKIEAVDFNNIGAINVTGGSNGNSILIDNLNLGTMLTISGVTGSISASFDIPGVDADLWLYTGNAELAYGLLDADGNLTLSLPDGGSGSAEFWGGPVNLGTISVVGGNDTWSGVDIGYSGTAAEDVVAGDVDVQIGNSSSFSLDIYATGDVTIGNVSMVAGNSAGLYYSAFAEGDILLGSINMTAGTYSTLDVDISGSGNISMGDVSLLADISSSVTLSVDAWSGDITIGNVTAVVGDFYGIEIDINNTNTTTVDVGEITVGDITAVAGNDANIDVEVTAYASYSGDVGNVSVGNVVAVAGGDSYIDLDFHDWAYYEDVGDLTVGDITASVGDNTSTVLGDTGVSVSVTAQATSGMVGNISVGNIDVTVGNGISNTITVDRVYGKVNIGNSGENGVGDVSVGNVTMTGGNYASLTFDQWNYNDDDGNVGNVTIGQISMTAGETAYVDIQASNYLYGSGTVGDMTVGGINVVVAQDSEVDISIKQYASAGDVGALNVGNISIVAGDNAEIDAYITSSAYDGNAGPMTVGDITIAASATTTVDLSGFSSIYMTIDHMAWYSHDLLGAETIGDITLSVGNDSSITLEIDQTGTATLVDDLSIGAVNLVAGNSSTVDAYIYFSNYMDDGDLANFSLEALNVTIGNDSSFDGYIDISKEYDGNLGDVSIGSISLNVGADSYASFSADISVSDGDAGNLDFGDHTIVAGTSSTVYLSLSADVHGDIASLGYGDLSFTVGEDESVYWSPTIWAEGDIGDIRVGDISANLSADAYLSVSLNVTAASGDIGNITIGDIDVYVGQDAEVGYLDFTFSASQDIGLMAVGDISISADVSSSLYASFSLDAGDDVAGMTVGDLSISALAGSTVSASFTISASGDAGFMTVGDISITAQDGLVTQAMIDATGDAFVAADLGLHANGAYIELDYNLYGDDDGDFTVGDITVNLDTLSDVNINISTTNSGDVNIGNLTVSGAVGVVDYAGTAANQTGSFDINVTTFGDITIGNVDYSGYLDDATIDLSWTDLGAASIIGSANDDIITGNAAANTISGGEGQDDMTGGAGNDTFAFNQGDSGLTVPTIDTITDWTSSDFLKFGLVNGSTTNYVEGTGAVDLADFLQDARDTLDSTIKYYADTFGGNTYVAVNYGSGEADMVVELVGVDLGAISQLDIIA